MGITHEMSPIYKYELIFIYSFISALIMIHDIFGNTEYYTSFVSFF